MAINAKAIIAILVIIIVILAALVAGYYLMPNENVSQENMGTAGGFADIKYATPTATPTPNPAGKVYLVDIFAGKLYPIDLEKAIAKLDFFESWRGRCLNCEINVLNAEGEMDQVIRGNHNDKGHPVIFVSGEIIDEIVYSPNGELVSQENVIAGPLPEGFASYLIDERISPMDRRGEQKIAIVEVFNKDKELVSIVWTNASSVKVVRGLYFDGSNNNNDSSGGTIGGNTGDTGSPVDAPIPGGPTDDPVPGGPTDIVI
ncbi:MAG: hypothetical protein WC428_04625 [Candidatus Paceibacterota bacterium]